MFFSRFDFVLSYRPNAKNQKPDALSCIMEESGSPRTNTEVDFILPETMQLSRTRLESDLCQANQDQLLSPECPKTQVFVPENKVNEVLKLWQDSHIFCHPGINKTHNGEVTVLVENLK